MLVKVIKVECSACVSWTLQELQAKEDGLDSAEGINMHIVNWTFNKLFFLSEKHSNNSSRNQEACFTLGNELRLTAVEANATSDPKPLTGGPF